MIFYKNFSGRRMKDREEEIQAIRRCNGRQTADGTKFELVELVLTRPSPNPEKHHNFQDTDITHEANGTINISNRAPGMGILRFEPSPYGNPTGYLNKTPHNMNTLMHCHRDDEWTFTDPAIAEEVKKMYQEWWKTVPQDERKRIMEIEEGKKRDAFSMPAVSGSVSSEAPKENLLAEIAELRETVRVQKELLDTKIAEQVQPKAEPEADPKKDGEDPDFILITSKAKYDFNTMEWPQIRKMAHEHSVPDALNLAKEPLIKALIAKLKSEELEPVPK